MAQKALLNLCSQDQHAETWKAKLSPQMRIVPLVLQKYQGKVFKSLLGHFSRIPENLIFITPVLWCWAAAAVQNSAENMHWNHVISAICPRISHEDWDNYLLPHFINLGLRIAVSCIGFLSLPTSIIWLEISTSILQNQKCLKISYIFLLSLKYFMVTSHSKSSITDSTQNFIAPHDT